MPRVDRTFTDADIVRFWARNLDDREQENVRAFFCFLCRAEQLRDRAIIDFVGSALGIIPVVGDALDFALESFLVMRELETIAELAVQSRALFEASGLDSRQVVQLFKDAA